jgi:hypothetical protein
MIINKNEIEFFGVPKDIKNTNDYTKIISLFFVDPAFYFNNETELQTESYWLDAVGYGYIIPIHEIKEVEDQSEDSIIGQSKLNYQFEIDPGKYKYIYRVRYDIDIYTTLKQYSEQYYKVYLVDKNINFYGKLTGDRIYPLDTNTIIIKKIKLQTQNPAFIDIYVEYSDASEFNYVTKLDFDITSVSISEVTISDFIASPATKLTFFVEDYCGYGVTDLIESDFTITDNVYGSVTPTLFENNGFGYYSITCANDYTNGTVRILSSKYRGQDDYDIKSVPVTISGFATVTEYNIVFDVTNDDTSNPVTNLILADVTSIVDDESGTLNITSFTNNGGGNYKVEVDGHVTSGTFTINSIRYNGVDNYTIGTAKTNVNINFLAVYGTVTSFLVQITEVGTGLPVNGLLLADFSAIDDLSGSLTLEAITPSGLGDGKYGINSDKVITSGTLTVNNATYIGSNSYDYNDLTLIHEEDYTSWSGSGFNQYPDGTVLSSNNVFDADNYLQDDSNQGHHYLNKALGNYQELILNNTFDTGAYFFVIRYKRTSSITSATKYFKYGTKKAGVVIHTNELYLSFSAALITRSYSLAVTVFDSQVIYQLINISGASTIDITIDKIQIYKLNS